MDFIQLLIFSAVFILLSLIFQVFAVKVLNLPKPVKKQKPINGTHRLIEITLLITGIAAVNFSMKCTYLRELFSCYFAAAA
ncbi:hypothetical protein B938_17090 [Bacillus velezensis AS43.3]|nr:hypothetical protein [Bacillus velezensis]AFZ92420.1 hypothetical protein B938_17090 [Bacillus velezensis AS43.3]